MSARISTRLIRCREYWHIRLFWVANTLEQVVELAALAALVSLFTTFPDGAVQRAYERVAVRLAWVAVALVPLFELLALPLLHLNDNEFTFDPGMTSPFFVPALGSLAGLALTAFDGRIALIPLAAALLLIRYTRMSLERRAQAKWLLLAVARLRNRGGRSNPIRGLIDLAEDGGTHSHR